jgi:hypothetical protein
MILFHAPDVFDVPAECGVELRPGTCQRVDPEVNGSEGGPGLGGCMSKFHGRADGENVGREYEAWPDEPGKEAPAWVVFQTGLALYLFVWLLHRPTVRLARSTLKDVNEPI